jgi:hypothetical protein
MSKPRVLYHASANKNLEELQPNNDYPRFEGEGPLVFATQHLAAAAMFLAPKSIPTNMSIFGDTHVLFINAREEQFIKADNGGAIYTLPGVTFETDPSIGMGENEWTSNVSVTPFDKTVYETSIRAMDEHGVVRYFVSDSQMTRIQGDPARALEVVNYIHE